MSPGTDENAPPLEERLLTRAIELARQVVELPNEYEPEDIRSTTSSDPSPDGSVDEYREWSWSILGTHDVTISIRSGDDSFILQVGETPPSDQGEWPSWRGSFKWWEVGMIDLEVRESAPGESVMNYVEHPTQE